MLNEMLRNKIAIFFENNFKNEYNYIRRDYMKYDLFYIINCEIEKNNYEFNAIKNIDIEIRNDLFNQYFDKLNEYEINDVLQITFKFEKFNKKMFLMIDTSSNILNNNVSNEIIVNVIFN